MSDCSDTFMLKIDKQQQLESDRFFIFLTAIATEKQGTPIGSNDLQITAIALKHDLTLVTHNTREFKRVPQLRLSDWEQD